jgi:hypothetical protein
VPKDAFLVTGDVTALYTNMDIQRTLEVTRDALRQHPDANRPDDYILRLLDITLNNNDFEFNGEYFLQICGTAMGKSYAPGLADLYMEKFDKKATAGNVVNQHLYHRFLDDIFFVWTGSEQQLIEYQTFINGIIPGITVTLNWSRDRVDFLDTTIYKQYGSEYDVLLTKVHFKPTDTHQLLHRGSFHPRHTTKGILKSQLIYTVGRNLARTLVSSKLRPITNSCSSTDTRKPANLPNGCFRCTSNHCRVCNYITAGTTFRSSHNNRSYSVEGHITCKTSNIIYLVTCRNCQQQYVGQTSRTLADRANDHLSYIRTRKTSKPTGLHFNQTGHTIQDFTIMGIEQLSTSSDLLPIAERKWQQLLQTNYPNGINQIHEHLLNRQPTAAGRASALS